MSAVATLVSRVPEPLRIWEHRIPPHSYALLRIALGIAGLTALLGLTPVEMYWPLDGLIPITSSRAVPREWLIEHGLSNLAGWTLFLVIFAACLAMTVGFFSDAAVVAAFAGQIIQARWNNSPLSAAHQVVTVLIFCLLWAPTGRVWSLDAYLRRKDANRAVEQWPVWPLLLMRFQVSLIYLSSALSKIAFPVWRDGSAVYWALSLNEFHRFPWVIPSSAAPLLAALTWATLAFEFLFPVFVCFRRTRPAALWAGVGLHVGLWLTLELGPFSWVMLASYLSFLDPEKTPNWFRFRATEHTSSIPGETP
jgi:hypothetical protein